MTDTINEPGASATAGFFQVTLKELKRIVAIGGGPNHLAAYLVLNYGVNGRQQRRYCTHGAKSVSDRAGIGYRIAEQAIEWLEVKKFISKPGADDPKHLGRGRSLSTEVRWVVADEQPDVAVSRQFIEGVRSNTRSPLKRMLIDGKGKDGISRRQAITDAILLFAAFMREQDFGEWAGVSPDAWVQRFVPVEGGEDDNWSDYLVQVEDTDGVLVTVKEDTGWTLSKFIEQSIGDGETLEDEISERFLHALQELRRLRLVYRTLVIWDGDPTDQNQRSKAEPIATLYINDPWAREYDPFVQYHVNRAAWRTWTLSSEQEFGANGEALHVNSGRYRYIVKAGNEKRTHLVGQLRVRYWAATDSMVIGRSLERQRTTNWQGVLEKLCQS